MSLIGKRKTNKNPRKTRKKYKIWKDNPQTQIPKSTLRRWARNLGVTNVDAFASCCKSIVSENASSYSASDLCSEDELCISNEGHKESDIGWEGNLEACNTEENPNLICDTDQEDTSDLLPKTVIGASEDESSEITTGDLLKKLMSISLYYDSNMSIPQSIAAIMTFYIKHRLSKAALRDLLTLFQHFLPENNLPKTEFQLLQVVNELIPPCGIQKFYYCKECLWYNGLNPELKACPSCISENGTNFFIGLDVIDQIKFLFDKRNLAEKLHVAPPKENYIQGITDGSEYRRVNARNNRQQFDLTLILNTDGISLSKSSKSHCWPLMFTIAEIPEHLRGSFIITMGIWYDTVHKPSMNTFLKPFCEKLRECFNKGVSWINPSTKETCSLKIIAPLFIADAPARAQLLNMVNFNGKFGCNICEIGAKSINSAKGKRKKLIYQFQNKLSLLRSGIRMEKQAKEALEKNCAHVNGVKGKSVISSLPFLDLGTCVVPEYMHSVLLGVVKQFLTLWMNPGGKFSIKKKVNDIDVILLEIRPPQFFNRMPRTITEYARYKASEFYNFLLFYSVPVLVDFLPKVYFQHWLLLVISIFNLLKQPITIFPDLSITEILLKLFVRDIGTLYSDRAYTYNVHQLLHLVLCVRRWGPLYASSAFCFENYNNFLANCVHGTKQLGMEMVNNLRLAQAVQNLNKQCEQSHDSLNIAGNNKFFNKIKSDDPVIASEKLFLMSQDLHIENLTIFRRARINNEIYTSLIYKDVKTNSFTVEIQTNYGAFYGNIKYYLKIDNDLSLVLALFTVLHNKMFIQEETDTAVSHIIPVHEEERYILIKLTEINFICHVIRVRNFVCKRPNLLKTVN